MNPIVGRQATAQIVGPNGPIDCGKWDEVNFDKDAVETETNKPIDGSIEHLVLGIDALGGTLSRGYYDSNIAQIIWDTMHPGNVDPPRLIVLITERFNDGTTRLRMYKNVLFTKSGQRIPRGRVTETIDWVAEDMEFLT